MHPSLGILRNLGLLTFFVLVLLRAVDEPRIDPEFPVNEHTISAPIVHPPIHDCARVVHVSGFMSKALVKVFANGVEVGKGTSLVGESDIPLSRALVDKESVTATQTVNGVTSDASDPAVPVTRYPKLTTPVVSSEIYACGRAVPVDNLVASTRVQVTDTTAAGSPVIGTGETPGPWFAVPTSSLVKDHFLTAVQTACPDTAPSSSPVTKPPIKVKASPTPVPKPEVDQDAVIVEGSEAIVLHKLLPGSEIEIKAGSTVISTGYIATASDNWFPLSIPVPTGHPKITATQKLCSTSPPSDPVVAVDTMTPPEIGSPICPGSRYVSIYKTVLNATVVLLRRKPGSATQAQVGSAGAVLGTLSFKVNKSVTLDSGDILTAVQYIVTPAGKVIVSSPSMPVVVGCDGGVNVITQHNDNFRTGAYVAETVLTPAKVLANGMREKYRVPLNGNVITQPLYAREVAFTTGGANGVFVGTTNNWFYALDANTGTQKWGKPLLDSDPLGRPAAWGVETTPVIDVNSNRIYVLFRTGNTNPPGNVDDYSNPSVEKAYWLVALDLRSGTELARVRVAASVFANDGTVQTFVAKNQTAHPALLLDHGSIYAAFGSDAWFESQPPYVTQYHGWVVQYRATDLAPQAVFCTSPNLNARPNHRDHNLVIAGSGIWQGGGGLAADPDGNVYLLTGNGRVEFENNLYGDSFLKLTRFGNALSPTAFVPTPRGGPDPDPDPDLLETGDADLGSGGPLLIPGFNLAIGGGKTGWMYLLDRTAMQFQQRIIGATNTYCTVTPTDSCRYDGWADGPHLHGSPTFWQGSNLLYVWGEKDFLHAFPFNPATQRFNDNVPPALKGPFPALPMPMPGAAMSLSAKGNTSGSGVLWAIVSVDNKRFPDLIQGRVYAFDAGNLRPLWDGALGYVPHMAPPTIADGKVFATTYDQKLVAYELGPEGHNQNWNPTIPTLSLTKCQSCHQATEVADLQRRHPWSERYINEASIWALPLRALQSLSPPQGVRRSLAVEGNGTQTYVAVEKNGQLVWTLKETTADLLELGPDGEVKPQQPVRVRLGAGAVFTANDNSRIVGTLQKTVAAPSAANVPWALFRVTASSGAGVLSGVSYVQCVYTHAGQVPVAQPQQNGQVSTVPYVAQYWFYR